MENVIRKAEGFWEEIVGDQEVVAYHGLSEYRGGYIYSGWAVARNDVLPGANILKTRWANSPTDEPETPKDVWAQAVQDAPVGAVLELSCSMDHFTDVVVTKVGHDEWKVTTLLS